MIFYDITFKTSQNLADNTFIEKLINQETSSEHNSTLLLYKINEFLDKECTNKNFMAQAYKAEDTLLYLACYYNCPTKEQLNIQQALADYLQQLLKVDIATETIAEIRADEKRIREEEYHALRTAWEQEAATQRDSLQAELPEKPL